MPRIMRRAIAQSDLILSKYTYRHADLMIDARYYRIDMVDNSM